MRWIAVILFCVVLSSTSAEPEPKKYKSEVKDKLTNVSLTEEERTFLREVEAKFGIKADVPLEEKKDDKEDETVKTPAPKAPFPAVIAIEIVNDTETNSKGKRTIDANLGYGYRTNNGYTYTYFGKQPQEKGKYMVYPYSQEDIPPSRPNNYHSHSQNSYTTSSPSVEIQPSRAYELVDVKEEQQSYHYRKPNPTQTTNYENIKGLVSPPPQYPSAHQETTPITHPSTFYTTYNGQDFSGLSGQFPMVMPNYFVESSQLLKNPQYQSAGFSQDYLRNHGTSLNQRVVPVLVLRVPSSYLKKPTAELYSNLPNNYPVSHYLNNVNLQELVNNYFKKIGYTSAPQVMAYQNSVLAEPVSTPSVAPSQGYQAQHYATPHVQHPSYTQSDYSGGVQYSAVQPVMAKYPSTHPRQHYYVPMAQSLYQQPQQQYEYTYQYVPQSEGQQSYYEQPQYQTQSEDVAQRSQTESAAINQGSNAGHVKYEPQPANPESAEPSVEYGAPEQQEAAHHPAAPPPASYYETPQSVSQEYGLPKEQGVDYSPQNTISTEYGPSKVPLSVYSSEQEQRPQYDLPKQSISNEALALYHSQLSQSAPKYSLGAASAGTQSYYYQKQTNDDSATKTLVISENYPSKDHTLATVLPLSYKRDRKPATVQTVSYVTPVPYSSKYQSQYKIMVPQTVLRNPATEKVSYVNSHSLPFTQYVNQEYNPEAEYTVPTNYAPPAGKQKPPSYPRNYHAHPKRNVKPEHKTDTNKNHKKGTKVNGSEKKDA